MPSSDESAAVEPVAAEPVAAEPVAAKVGPKPAQARSPQHAAKRVSLGLAVGVVLWAGTAMGGMGWLIAYKAAAGRPAIAPVTWPSQVSIAHDDKLPTLVMVVHPKCSCSRASIGELSKLMTRLSGKVTAHVLFLRPEGLGEDWAKSDIYESAKLIQGVTVSVDASGTEAQRFGALTSGQTYLYSPQGQLLFSGGVTNSRGHHGDNAGSKTILAIVNAETTGRIDTATNVYGCEIPDPESGPKK